MSFIVVIRYQTLGETEQSGYALPMKLPPKLEPTRVAHKIVTALLLAQLVLPLFFSLQIALIWAGADAFTASPERVRVIVQETPLLAVIAPFLRTGLIAAMLYTHHRQPRWTLALLTISIVIHIIGWTAILGNPYFNAPTGYVTLTVGLTLLILLLLIPALRGRRI